MPDLLIELLSEEIPARMQRAAAAQLRKRVTDAFVEAGLTYEGAREYWTPRRLTLDLRGLTTQSADVVEERKGPRTDAPQKALEGFMRAAGLARLEEAQIRSDAKKGDFYVAVTERKGRPAQAIVAEVVPSVVREFTWPKSMRWGAASAEPGSLRWVRPLQSILCVFGPETEETEIVSFEIGGLSSGNTTVGHRFMASGQIEARRFSDYVERLEAAKVMLDAGRRQETISGTARNLAFALGCELVEDETLLEEVGNLVEWPVVLTGEFLAEYLELPDEVIRLTIRDNQKCFVMRQPHGGLTNRFVLSANIEAEDGGAEIVRGNAKVVNARLADASFFWKTDLQVARSPDGFEQWLSGLAKVTFHARLGSQADRIRRIETLAGELAPIAGADPAVAARAAHLAKADLQSQMVFEFPELQGHMGRHYALAVGENEAVARAIEEHYKPLGPSDVVPVDPVSVAVALADKLDMLASFWAIEERPTGSKDPYALRRAALGVIRLVLENGLRLPLADVLGKANLLLNETYSQMSGPGAQSIPDLLSFFHDRLKVYLRDTGARYDLIDAVIAPDSDDLALIERKVGALQGLMDTADGENLLAGYKRAANILADEAKKGTQVADRVDTARFDIKAEQSLFSSLQEVERDANAAIAAEDFEKAMSSMATLRKPIDRFFDEVMVNAEDPQIRANRLALLARIREVTARIADLGKIAA